MGSATFPLSRVHAVAAASCLLWSLVTLVVHLASRALWRGYRDLRPSERRQWCNKITCGLHVSRDGHGRAAVGVLRSAHCTLNLCKLRNPAPDRCRRRRCCRLRSRATCLTPCSQLTRCTA